MRRPSTIAPIVYRFTLFAHSNPSTSRPRNATTHDTARLGGLCIASTIKLFVLVVRHLTLFFTIFHSNVIVGDTETTRKCMKRRRVPDRRKGIA